MCAQSYYWVGGTGDWTDLSHWSNTSGGAGNAFVQVPLSINDVVIDANSGFSANLVTARTLTLPASNATCRNLTILPDVAGLRIIGAQRLDVYGAITLGSNLGVLSAWTGEIRLFSPSPALHELAGMRLYNSLLRIEPTGGEHTIRNYRSTGTLQVEASAGTATIFEGSFMGGTFSQISGDVVFSTPITGQTSATTRLPSFTWRADNLTLNQPLLATTVEILGGNATALASTNISTLNVRNDGTVADFSNLTHTWTNFYAYTNTSPIINISNASINGLTNWYFYFNTGTLQAGGSTLNFANVGNFVAGGQAYNNVNFNQRVTLRRSNGASSGFGAGFGSGINTGSFNSLQFQNGFMSLVAGTDYTISGNLYFGAGGAYNDGGAGTIFRLGAGAGFQALGTCENRIPLHDITTYFDAAPALSLNNLRMSSCQAIGADAPYQAGTDSYGFGNSNWNAGAVSINQPKTGRNLRWVGDIPSHVDSIDFYAIWEDSSSWADGDLHPAAMPNSGLGGVCPPTMYDNVVFPNGSYVRVNSPFIETRDMIWEGAGNFVNPIHTLNNAHLEIHGSLEWSASMSLNYDGRISLRGQDNNHFIRSNNKAFPFRLAINTLGSIGTYEMLDGLVCSSTANQHIFELVQGNLKTNGHFFQARNFYSLTGAVRSIDFDTSTVHITGGHFTLNGTDRYCFAINSDTSNLTIIADSAEFHFTGIGGATNNDNRIVLGGGHHFGKFFISADYMYVQRTGGNTRNIYKELNFKNAGALVATTNRDSLHVLRTHTAPSAIGGNLIFLLSQNNTTNTHLAIDSAFFYGNATLSRIADYTHLLHLEAGFNYILGSNLSQHRQQLLPTARLEAVGNCQKYIGISGGFFQSNLPQSGDYLILGGNNAAPATFTHTNSIEISTNTGWVGGTPSPRTLYWFDGQAGASSGNWDSNSHWSLADGFMLDALGGNDPAVGNCPPTRNDDVFFTDASFNHPNDSVQIALLPKAAECRNMTWSNTPAFAPVLSCPASNPPELLHLYGSLAFSPTMVNNFVGDVHFLGSGHSSTIRSNSIAFARRVFFNGAGCTWTLQDSLHAPLNIAYSLYLQQGTLNSNDHNIRVYSFFSNYATTRRLILGKSKFSIIGFHNSGATDRNFDVRGSNISIDADEAEILFLHNSTSSNHSAFLGVGHHYGRISTATGKVQFTGTNLLIDTLHIANSAWINLSNSQVRRLTAMGTTPSLPLQFTGAGNVFDTVRIAGNAFFQASNQYAGLLELSAARTYTFYSGTVQHLLNSATFLATGTGGGGEIFFNSNSTTNQGYIRKDSGIVCVDYIYVRDVWVIGDGVQTQTPCASPLCDTLESSSYLPTIAASGRAIFQGGSNADGQGNNAGWNFNPYPPVPIFTLRSTPPFAICSGEVYTATFEIANGRIPMEASYAVEVGGLVRIVDSFNIQPASGSGTVGDPYIWLVQVPIDSGLTTRISADKATFDYCLKRTGTGTGTQEAFVAPCVLALQVQNFSAVCEQQSSKIRWKSEYRADISHFLLTHSSDALGFRPMAALYPSPEKSEFAYTDAQYGKGYYRLEQHNTDGSIDLSPIIFADCAGEAQGASIYPNPTKEQAILRYFSPQEAPLSLSLVELGGKTIWQQTHSLHAGAQQIPIDCADLPAGLYLLRLVDASGSMSHLKLSISR